jgi:hypothetical protein
LRSQAREVRDSFGDPTRWLACFEDSLARAVGLARTHALRVILIQQPWFDKPVPDPEEEAMLWCGFVGDIFKGCVTAFYSHRAVCALMRLVNDATARVGERMGADVLRPAEAMEVSAQTYYDHFHFTPLGAAQLGKYVARQLLDLEGKERKSRPTPYEVGTPGPP